MTVSELLEIAKSELPNVKIGEEFTLKDLFKGYIWNRIAVGTRSKLGTSFTIFVDGQEDIKTIKATGGQRRYVKIS